MEKTLLSGLAGLLMTVSAASAEDITILAWPGDDAEKALRKVVAAYNDTQGGKDGVKADLIYFSRANFFDKMQTDAAAGSKEFDVMLTATYNIGRYAPYMTPIDGIIDDKVYEVFPPNVMETQKFEGRVYGIPTDLSLHFLYFRKDLIDQLLSDAAWKKRYGDISEERLGARMTPKHPSQWTWDDFTAAALFFTKSVNRDSPTRFGTVLQMKNLLFNMMIWQGTAASHGGDWRDASGSITVDSPAFRKGLEIFKVIADNRATPGDSISFEYGEANAAFGSGQVAFMLQWNAAYPSLNDPEQHPQSAGKFDVAPQPAGPEGRKTHFHSLGLGVHAASDKQDSAMKFLRWLGTSKEAYKMYASGGGAPPVTEDIMAVIAESRPDMALMGEHAGKYGFVMNGGASAHAMHIYEVMAENFTGYWAGQMSEDEAVANVEAAMKKAFGN